MSRICKGCGCSLPTEYADCGGDNRHKNIQDETAHDLFRSGLAHGEDRDVHLVDDHLKSSNPYRIDPDRISLLETGIPVRALDVNGSWGAIDIAHLDRVSLDAWLRSRDSIDWPVNVVMILLGHPRP